MPITSTHRTYAHLFAAGKRSLLSSKENSAGSFHLYLQANLLFALTLEAYANHIGEAEVAGVEWDIVEKASPQDKLRFLNHRLALGIDFGAGPFQHLKAIFQFRNTLAHGRTVTVAGGPYDGSSEKPIQWPQAPWMQHCTSEAAWKWADATKSMIELLDAPLRTRNSPGYPHLWSQSDGYAAPDEIEAHQ